MKEILEAVMRRLKEQVPDLAYVSEDWGQMDYYNEAPPVKFPCALISVSHISFESETWGLRRARLTFLIRIADCPVLTGNMAAPEQHRSRAFAIFDLMEQVAIACMGSVPMPSTISSSRRSPVTTVRTRSANTR